MILKAGFKGFWFYYTLAIPLVALSALAGLLLGIMGFNHGWWLLGAVLFGTFLFNLRMFRTVSLTLPRWAVRWVLIWGYSLGILKAVFKC